MTKPKHHATTRRVALPPTPAAASAPSVPAALQESEAPPQDPGLSDAAEDEGGLDIEPEPHRICLPRLNYATMTDEDVPINVEVATEALRFLFCSKAWHDNPDLLHRKVRKWKETLYDGGWELKARAMRAENPARWTFARIAKQLAVPRPAVEALFRRRVA